jgi:hypothetical protein
MTFFGVRAAGAVVWISIETFLWPPSKKAGNHVVWVKIE